MTDYPKVSVVTITYGHEKYITQTLDGILMQDYPGEIEFIIANDNSPDSTDERVKNYFNEKPTPANFDLKYTKHDTNKGMMPNFIWALEQATGEYIALCEGDDYWTDPLKLQKQVDFLGQNREYILTFHPVKILKEDGNLINDFITQVPENYELQETLAKGPNYIHTPSVVFRNIIQDFPPEFSLSPIGDYFLYMLLTKHGKMKMLHDNMSIYRQGVGVWSNLQIAERIANTTFCVKLIAHHFKDDERISGIVYVQHTNLIDKMQKTVLQKEAIVNEFVNDLKEVEIRITVGDIVRLCLMKFNRRFLGK